MRARTDASLGTDATYTLFQGAGRAWGQCNHEMLAALDRFVRRYAGDEADGARSDAAPTSGAAHLRAPAPAPAPPPPPPRLAPHAHCRASEQEHARPKALCGDLAGSEEDMRQQHGINPLPAHPSLCAADHDASYLDHPVDDLDLDPEHRMWRSEGRLPRLAYDARFLGRGSRSSLGRNYSTESLISKASTCSSAPPDYGGDDNSFYRMLDVGVFA